MKKVPYPQTLMEPPDGLKLDQSWSLGEAAFDVLLRDLRALEPATLVEFGSGVSSIRLALELPNTQILAIDHSPEYYARTQDLVARHRIGPHLRVELRPLQWQWHALALYQSYKPGAFPPCVDAVIVDGPPNWTRRGREACLHSIAKRLRVGAHVYLDDCRRLGERRILENWQRSYPGVFSTHLFPVDHHLCILEKTRETDGPRFAPSVVADIGYQNLHRTARRIRDLIRG